MNKLYRSPYDSYGYLYTVNIHKDEMKRKAFIWTIIGELCLIIILIVSALGFGYIFSPEINYAVVNETETPTIVETLSLNNAISENLEEQITEEITVDDIYYEDEPEYEEIAKPISLSLEGEYELPAVYSDGLVLSDMLTKTGGVNYFNGRKETWYSQRVLPGGGLDIPGRHVDEYGLIRDIDGYICVAADDLEYLSVVETSLGLAKVYDCGTGAAGITDIYVDW